MFWFQVVDNFRSGIDTASHTLAYLAVTQVRQMSHQSIDVSGSVPLAPFTLEPARPSKRIDHGRKLIVCVDLVVSHSLWGVNGSSRIPMHGSRRLTGTFRELQGRTLHIALHKVNQTLPSLVVVDFTDLLFDALVRSRQENHVDPDSPIYPPDLHLKHCPRSILDSMVKIASRPVFEGLSGRVPISIIAL
jgi:hypothetical protein